MQQGGTVLNTSIATGAMALTPEHAWIYLVICRLFVGFGVTGMYSVDITIIQEFVPTAKRGWLTGLTATMLPAGFLLGALLSAFATPYIGWRGLFAGWSRQLHLPFPAIFVRRLPPHGLQLL